MSKSSVTELYNDDTTLRERVGVTIDKYESFFDASDADAKARKADYAGVVNAYYDVVTDFYEYGWGESFHFAARHHDETFRESILRHEYYLAAKLGLRPGMHSLDVGAGVGGPARAIARFSQAKITGVNNNDYQVARAGKLNQAAGLAHLVEVVKGDFMHLPMADGTFDAAYAIEATCHAPDRRGVFGEVFRVLKPGGSFFSYEWCLTDTFEATNAEHRRVKEGIERGNGLPELVHTSEVDQAFSDVGFEILETRDMVADCDPQTPWYLPLDASMTLAGFRHTRIGRTLTHFMVRGLEALRVAPKGSTETSSMLMAAATALVAGGKSKIFTPMQMYVVRKPG